MLEMKILNENDIKEIGEMLEYCMLPFECSSHDYRPDVHNLAQVTMIGLIFIMRFNNHDISYYEERMNTFRTNILELKKLVPDLVKLFNV